MRAFLRFIIYFLFGFAGLFLFNRFIIPHIPNLSDALFIVRLIKMIFLTAIFFTTIIILPDEE